MRYKEMTKFRRMGLFALALFIAIFIGERLFERYFGVGNGDEWRSVQEQSKNTVVQLFADSAIFDWTEPYQSPSQGRSVGSGFFIDKEGFLVSNYHLVDEATIVKIQIPSFGKERFDVQVVGVCPQADIALLRLTKESLEKVRRALGSVMTLELGDSDKVVRTQEVLTLGYPLGQQKLKSTKGIVSGRQRVWGESYLQTTSPVNEGSSGGPLLNTEGEVIGITTATIAGSENVGYVIPINDVKHVIKNLHTTKFLRKPILGCEFNIATEEMVSFLKNPDPGGVYISQVYKGSLMQQSGVQNGDMLYKLNGYVIDRYGEVTVPWTEDKVHLGDVVNRFKMGDVVSFVLYRNGRRVEGKIHFSFVSPLPIRFSYPELEKIDYEIIGGMVIMELKLNHIAFFKKKNPYLVKYYKRKNQYESKLIITHIFSGSQAKQARSILRGGTIDEVNGEPVKTLGEFRAAVLKGKVSRYLTIKSDKKRLTVLSLDKVLQDEERLSKTYRYKKSRLYNELVEPTSSAFQATLL